MTYIDNSNNVKEHFYALVCIDEVSKFVFCSFLKRKLSKDVKQGFVSIIKKIREMQNKTALLSINENLIFYADSGSEFKFKDVIQYCKSNNSKIINIGTPGVTKLGIIERVIRTLQEMLSLSINNISNKYQYKKEVKQIIKIYNKQKHSFTNSSPYNLIMSEKIHLKPWNISKETNNNFEYFKNKKKIKRKLNDMKKDFPILQSVRLYKKIKKQYKRSHFSTWSNQIYFVDGYKIPLLNTSDIGIYLSQHDGTRIKGITYKENLKKVKMSKYLQIKNIIAFMKKKKAIKCSFDNFPDSHYKDILISELDQYFIPKRLRHRIKNWREKNDL